MNIFLPKSWECPNGIANKDGARWLIANLLRKTHMMPDHVGGFPVWSVLLEKVIGRTYADVVRVLVDAGHIERVANHSTGIPGVRGRSREYRLADNLASDKVVRYRIQSPELKRNLEKNGNIFGVRADLFPVYGHLKRQLERIEIDRNAPTENSIPLSYLNDRSPWLSVCHMGRVHTPITCLKKTHRHHLKVDGQPLFQVDIRSSQVLINAIAATWDATPQPVIEYARLLDPKGKYNRTGHLSVDSQAGFRAPWKILEVDLLSTPVDNPICSGLGLVPGGAGGRGGAENEDTIDTQPLDLGEVPEPLSELIRICREEDVYLALQWVDPVTGKLVPRHVIKSLLIHTLYDQPEKLMPGYRSKNRFQNRLRAKLRNRFPQLIEFLIRRNETNESKHGEAARYAQTLESYTVIKLAVEDFTSMAPEAFIASVHDSLVVTESNIGLARSAICGAFLKVFGQQPGLKVAEFGSAS